MNWKTFFAMLARDVHVARRNFVVLLLQTFLQPLMFVFIFGRVMVRSGYMPESYKSLLLPGIMAISMVFTGVWAVAMPLIAEFQFTREIEDRLLAPMEISWVAVEKVLAGTLQALDRRAGGDSGGVGDSAAGRGCDGAQSSHFRLRYACWWHCSPPAAVLPWAAALISNTSV